MIELFTAPTPNGLKIPILLEELGLEWTHQPINLAEGEQRSATFLAMNPNGKIPVLVDGRGTTPPIVLFESAAIMLHLTEGSGQLRGTSPQARADTVAWLVLQVAGLGPSFGNAGWAHRTQDPAPASVIERFDAEALRYANLVEARLTVGEWMNGEAYSIADIAHFCWLRVSDFVGIDRGRLPVISEWIKRIEARPAVKRAFARMGVEN